MKRNERRHEQQQGPEKIPATGTSNHIAGSDQQEKLDEVFRSAELIANIS